MAENTNGRQHPEGADASFKFDIDLPAHLIPTGVTVTMGMHNEEAITPNYDRLLKILESIQQLREEPSHLVFCKHDVEINDGDCGECMEEALVAFAASYAGIR